MWNIQENQGDSQKLNSCNALNIIIVASFFGLVFPFFSPALKSSKILPVISFFSVHFIFIFKCFFSCLIFSSSSSSLRCWFPLLNLILLKSMFFFSLLLFSLRTDQQRNVVLDSFVSLLLLFVPFPFIYYYVYSLVQTRILYLKRATLMLTSDSFNFNDFYSNQ